MISQSWLSGRSRVTFVMSGLTGDFAAIDTAAKEPDGGCIVRLNWGGGGGGGGKAWTLFIREEKDKLIYDHDHGDKQKFIEPKHKIQNSIDEKPKWAQHCATCGPFKNVLQVGEEEEEEGVTVVMMRWLAGWAQLTRCRCKITSWYGMVLVWHGMLLLWYGKVRYGIIMVRFGKV